MQRRGFRHLLPVVLTVLYVALIHSGYSKEQKYQQAAERARAEMEKQQALHPEEEYVSFYDFPHSPPRGIQLALGINLPALLVALPVHVMVRSDPATTYWTLGVLVPFLWFLVGRRIDRRIGWLPPKQTKSVSDLKATAFAMCSGFAALPAGLCFVGWIFGSFQHEIVLPLAVAVWSSDAAIFLYVRARK